MGGLTSRSEGANARDLILDVIKKHGVVLVDINNEKLTPSFADECFGVIAESFGLENFKKKVKLINVTPNVSTLVKHVVIRRVQTAPPISAYA